MDVIPNALHVICICTSLCIPLLWFSPHARQRLIQAKSATFAWAACLFSEEEPHDETQSEKVEGDQNPLRVMKLVIDLARPELPLIILATLASLTSSVSELLSPILLGYALDLVVKQGTSAPIRDLLLLFAGIFALDFLTGACEFIKHGKNNDIGDFVRQRARGLLFSSVLHQDQAFLDQYHSSTFNLQYSMLDELHGLTGHLIPDLTGSTLSLLVTGFYLLNKNLLLGLLVLFIFSIQGLIQALSDKHRGVLYKKLLIFEQQCNAFREEAWNSAKTVKSFRAEDRLSRSFDSLLNRDRAIRCALVKSHATHESSSFLMSSLSSNLVWLIGLLSLIVTELGKRDEGGTGSKSSFISSAIGFRSLGELSAFLVIISKIRGAAIRFLRSISGLRKASSKLHQSLHLIHCEPNMKQGALTFPLISNTAAAKDDELNAPPSLRVDFKEVHFRYASRPTIEVLSGLNLTLEAGQVTALCGPSGGGKSTISALTLRLYDPSEGQVLFNGVDLRDLSNAALSGLVSIVSQEPVLFSDTIESNIKFGNSEATDQQFKEAALAANCHEFISGFTSGYQTQVGEKGVRLSGGQKQRIAIARALLCNPSLLILDEASSALDAESEHLVQEATERLMAGRTVLVVAHRLSTIRLADKIVVISEGRAVEEGRHEDLITHERGIYRQLIKRQLNG